MDGKSTKSQGVAPEEDVREKFWRTARKAAAQVPFMDEVVAGYYCAMDRSTPLRAKGILLAALAYFVLPTPFPTFSSASASPTTSPCLPQRWPPCALTSSRRTVAAREALHDIS